MTPEAPSSGGRTWRLMGVGLAVAVVTLLALPQFIVPRPGQAPSRLASRQVPVPFGGGTVGLQADVTQIGTKAISTVNGSLNIGIYDVTFPSSETETLLQDRIYLIEVPAAVGIESVVTVPLDEAFPIGLTNYYGYRYSDANASTEIANRDSPAFSSRFPSNFFASPSAVAINGMDLAMFASTYGITFEGTSETADIQLAPNSLYALVMNDPSALIDVVYEVTCGDEYSHSPEACDEGGVDTMSCDEDCTLPICGDGHLNTPAGEECDDGGTSNGDGCDANCDEEAASSSSSSAGLGCSVSGSPTVITYWDFNTNDGNANTGTTSPATGAGSISLLQGVTSAFFAGSPSDTAPLSSGLNTTTYPTQSTFDKLAGTRFDVSTLGYGDITFAWDSRFSATASKFVRLQFSFDGGNTWIDSSQITGLPAAAWFTTTTDLSAIPLVENNPLFAARLVAEMSGGVYVGTTTTYAPSGTIRYDRVTVTGTPCASSSSSSGPVCGNFTCESPSEQCDGADFCGATCLTYGYDDGSLACSSCTTSTAGCYDYSSSSSSGPVCGNFTCESPSEQCDGADFCGATCETYGFDAGSLLCSSCLTSTASCYDYSSASSAAPVCGDMTINGTDQCDPFVSPIHTDDMTCDDDCTYVVCGDSHLNSPAGEQCDDGGTSNGDGCSAMCQIESSSSAASAASSAASSAGVCDTINAISGYTGTAVGTTSGSPYGYTCVASYTPQVVYSWTAPATGTFIFSLCNGTSFDSALAINPGFCSVGAAAAGCSDTSDCGMNGKITLSATFGTTYYITVSGGMMGGDGFYQLDWSSSAASSVSSMGGPPIMPM